MDDTKLPADPHARVGGDVRAIFWDDFVGQDHIKRRLETRINAALLGDRPLDHVLLTAPPGYGKTTLAHMIAGRLLRAFKPFVCPVSLGAVRDALKEHEGEALVVFLDEIHLLTVKEQEGLLTLLEEGFMEDGDGGRLWHPNVTVIAGTTKREKVQPALYDRFPIRPVFTDYDDDEMARVVRGMASRLGVDVDLDLCRELGLATGGTPRNARGLVSAARDLIELNQALTAEAVADLAGVTPDGLNEDQLRYLGHLADSDKGHLGLNPLAAMMQLRTTVVEDLERLLIKRGYVELGVKGREMTKKGRERVEAHRRTGK